MATINMIKMGAKPVNVVSWI